MPAFVMSNASATAFMQFFMGAHHQLGKCSNRSRLSITTIAQRFHGRTKGQAPGDARDERSSQYGASQIVLSALTRQHNAKAGFYGFCNATRLSSVCRGLDVNAKPMDLEQHENPHGDLGRGSSSKISTSQYHG